MSRSEGNAPNQKMEEKTLMPNRADYLACLFSSSTSTSSSQNTKEHVLITLRMNVSVCNILPNIVLLFFLFCLF